MSSKEATPFSLEAETACLGAVLLKNNLFDGIFAKVEPSYFYDGRNKIIAETILSIRKKRGQEPIDLVTLINELKTNKQLSAVGGTEYVSNLIDTVPTTTNSEQYATIVREKALLRQISDCGHAIISLAKRGDLDANKVLDQAQEAIFNIAKSQYSDFLDFKTAVHKTFEELQEHYNNTGRSIGIESEFKRLDDVLAGMHPSNLIIIGGRPAMGKTAFVLSVLENIAISKREKERVPVGFFSLEMSHQELCTRILCAKARLPTEKLRKNALSESDFPKLMNAAENMYNAPVYIDDTPGLNILEIASKARRMVDLGVKLIVIDYLQLIGGEESSRYTAREQFISYISRSLKKLARSLKIPIIGLTQLNRANESRTDKRPLLSDIRESGAIEQDADVVCFIHRESYYQRDNEELKNQAEVIVAKNRHGRTDTVKLLFHGHYPRFDNLSEDDRF